MALGDRIRQRRKDRGWTEEDFAERKAKRQAIWAGVKTVAGFIPGASSVVAAVDTAEKIIKPMIATDDVGYSRAVDKAVATPEIDVDTDLGDVLKGPVVKAALELSQELIASIEEKAGIDIPAEVEAVIFDTVMDAVEDLYDEMEDRVAEAGKAVFKKIVEWITGLFK